MMDEIRRQVKRAQRRIVLQQLLTSLPWFLLAYMLLALVAVVAAKIWPIGVASSPWLLGWLVGGAAAGFITAFGWLVWRRRGALEAAIEVDRRCGLKERISSVLAMSDPECESGMGRALLEDASRRVDKIDVGEEFRVSVGWPSLLPVLTAGLVCLIGFLVSDATREDAHASLTPTETQEQVNKSVEELKKKIAEQRKQAEALGLKDAEKIFREIEQGIDELNRSTKSDRQKTMVKLNDLAKELEKRREQLGGSERMKRHFENLKKVSKGPADKLAKAMAEMDFNKALQELAKLKEQMKDENLTDEERQRLADQLEQMARALNEAAAAREAAKQKLEQQIKERMEAGDREGAARLQQKLDNLNQQDQQMSQMEQIASDMMEACENMRDGDMNDASSKLDELEMAMGQMQNEMEELETLENAMEQFAQAKNSMNCQQCMGSGCPSCGLSPEGIPGRGMSEGQGQGERPEEETDINTYESRVRGNLQRGEMVRKGDAGGANVSGRSVEDVKQEIISSLAEDPDPLTDQVLPRTQRNHAQQYNDLIHGLD